MRRLDLEGRLRAFGLGYRQAAAYRRQKLRARAPSRAPFGKPTRQPAGAGECINGFRRVACDLKEYLVAQHPASRNVAPPGFRLAPGRDLAKHG